jgi:hypothetical protein
MEQNGVELRISGAARARIENWLRDEMLSVTFHGLIGAVFLALLALAATIFVYIMLVAIALRLFIRAGGEAGAILALGLPVVVLVAMHPVYLFWGRPRAFEVPLKEGIVFVPNDGLREIGKLPEDRVEFAFEWRAVVDYLMFPAWLAHNAVQQVLMSLEARRADTGTMTGVLVLLIHLDRRVSLFDIEDAMPTPKLAHALNALRNLDGILLWRRDFASISMNDELRAKLVEMV